MRGIRALGFHGVKIGEPFHETVIEHLDELTEAARRCGSVNCITTEGDRLVGDNTEGLALVELVRQQITPIGRRAMIIGAGRLARAIARGAGRRRRLDDHRRQPQRPTRAANWSSSSKQQTASPASLVALSGGTIAVEPDIARAGERHVARHGRCPTRSCRSIPNSFGSEDGRRRRGLQHVAHLAHAAGGRARLPHHRRPLALRPANGPRPARRGPASCRTRSRCAKRRRSFLGI